MSENNKIILYQDDNEIIRVSVRFSDEDLWLTQNQLAEIYCTTQQNISQHVDNIYKDGELFTEATNKKFLLVRQEGNRQVRRNIGIAPLSFVSPSPRFNRICPVPSGKVYLSAELRAVAVASARTPYLSRKTE